uniref:Uncharacterized protein MANES_13G155200 n=1 Tax=Rhizophora mucronata TaxID=61149 RepID=A0A2P2MSA2_RHIMU
MIDSSQSKQCFK